MKIIYGVNKIKRFRKPVVALGVFDGVHKGHREILKAAVKTAKCIHGSSMAVTFWPHPQKKKSLYSLKHRLRLMEELRIDVCLVINFNRSFAKLNAEDFIRRILLKKIGAACVIVGENFRFGKNARGNVQLLAKAGRVLGFHLKTFKVRKVDGLTISSTSIRALVRKGRLRSAQRLLGRPVSVLGTVIKGISLGRKIGFPTANIDPHHEVIPPEGVYAAKVILENRKYFGACYIGPRPKFLPRASRKLTRQIPNIEVYILNLRKNIYHKDIEVQFLKKIRAAFVFTKRADLIRQINKDVTFLKRLLSRH